MNVIYSQIEQEIVDRLAPLTAQDTLDVLALPENQADYERPFLHGRITVAYKSSDFGAIRSTNEIVQDEKIQIEVIIQARKLKGSTGLHSITEAVKRRLLGFDPTDCSKLYLVNNTFKEFNNDSALWLYSMVFECRYTLVENAEYGTEQVLEQINFEYNEEVPSIPAIPFPGTVPNPPIENYKGDIAYWDGEVWRRLHPGEVGHVLATQGQGEVPEWVEPQSGPQGEQGAQGIQGIQGEKGDKGDTGDQGIQGIQGEKGDKGDTGAQGIQGDPGVILLDSHIGGSVGTNNEFSRLRDVLIPANILVNGDVIDISIVVTHNLANIKNCRIHLRPNLTTPLSSENVIASSTAGISSTVLQPLKREIIYWNNSIQLLQLSNSNIAIDPTSNLTRNTSEMYAFNPSVDNYLTISAGSSNDNSYVKNLIRSLFKIIKA